MSVAAGHFQCLGFGSVGRWFSLARFLVSRFASSLIDILIVAASFFVFSRCFIILFFFASHFAIAIAGRLCHGAPFLSLCPF